MSFRVYKASAGSGKTFTLVKEYLLLVLKNPEKYSRILAVTFTNKAANEMKERIVHALSKLADTAQSDQGDDPLLDQLVSESGMDKGFIRQRAIDVLSLVIHNYSDFSIGTIDSFVYKLVRTFAHDLHLPYQFEVELNDRAVVNLAVDMLIDKVGTDDYITNTLLRFLLQRMSDEGSWLIEHDIARFCNYLLREDGFDHINKLEEVNAEVLTKAIHTLNTSTSRFESKLASPAINALQLIHQHEIQPEHLANGRNGVYAFLNKIAARNIADARNNSSATKVSQDGKWTSGKGEKDKLAFASINSIAPKLDEHLQTIMNVLDSGFELYLLQSELAKNMYSLAVLSELQHNMEEIRSEENLVHISEFNKRIARLLTNVAVAYIYERLGERFQHYLIDEFQDTSVLQWHNFIPLIDNALANQNLTLVVGDAKQAIYRFRSGEVEQFMQLPSIYRKDSNHMIADAEFNLKAQYDYRNLAYNYRSDEVIVQFNNDFFDYVSAGLPGHISEAYTDHKQEAVKPKGSGYVQIQYLKNDDVNATIDQVYLAEIHENILSRIAEGFRPSEIAILTQKNSEGSQIARYLTNKGLEVVSAEALLLESSIRVRLLVNLLKLIQHGYEPVAITTIFHDLGVLYPDQDFNWSLQLQTLMATDPEQQMRLFTNILQSIGFTFSPVLYHTMSLYDMVERLLRQSGFDKLPDPYVQFFLEFVHEFQVRRQGSLVEFLGHWSEEKEKLSVIVPQSANAIQVMTIHKAKGLEFPVVIFPFATKGIRLTKKEFWVDLLPDEVPGLPVGLVRVNKKLKQTRLAEMYEEETIKSHLDMVNLLYVVMTRASRRLYIMTELPGKQANASYQHYFKQYLTHKQLWQDDKYVYCIGNEENALPDLKTPSSKDLDPDQVFISDDWTSKLRIAPDPISHWIYSDEGKAVYWGQLVHEILAEIRYSDDAQRVLDQYLEEGTISPLQHEELTLLFDRMFAHPVLMSGFREGAKLFLERELISADGKVYRPDRCVSFDDHMMILDYKTGLPDEKHLQQMQVYKQLMHEVGTKKVDAYLVYLHDDFEVITC